MNHTMDASDDEPVPNRLYKYRRRDLGTLSSILIDSELWAASPTTFNDPFDCFPDIDLSGTYDEALAFIDLRTARTGMTINRENRRKMARDIHKRGLGSISGEGGPATWRQSIEQFGVVSFSESCTDILMWSHYAENHTGVCLEFGTETQPISFVAKVVYGPERPAFRPLEPDRTHLIERILLHKADIWSYEREWRYLSIKEGAGKTRFPPSALKAVILGAAADEAFERALMDLIAAREVQVPVRRARFDEKTFRLHV